MERGNGNHKRLTYIEETYNVPTLNRMGYLMTAELSQGRGVQYYYNVNQSDVRALVRAELKALQRQLTTAKGQTADTLTKYHYEDCIERINQLLEPK